MKLSLSAVLLLFLSTVLLFLCSLQLRVPWRGCSAEAAVPMANPSAGVVGVFHDGHSNGGNQKTIKNGDHPSLRRLVSKKASGGYIRPVEGSKPTMAKKMNAPAAVGAGEIPSTGHTNSSSTPFPKEVERPALLRRLGALRKPSWESHRLILHSIDRCETVSNDASNVECDDGSKRPAKEYHDDLRGFVFGDKNTTGNSTQFRNIHCPPEKKWTWDYLAAFIATMVGTWVTVSVVYMTYRRVNPRSQQTLMEDLCGVLYCVCDVTSWFSGVLLRLRDCIGNSRMWRWFGTGCRNCVRGCSQNCCNYGVSMIIPMIIPKITEEVMTPKFSPLVIEPSQVESPNRLSKSTGENSSVGAEDSNNGTESCSKPELHDMIMNRIFLDLYIHVLVYYSYAALSNLLLPTTISVHRQPIDHIDKHADHCNRKANNFCACHEPQTTFRRPVTKKTWVRLIQARNEWKRYTESVDEVG